MSQVVQGKKGKKNWDVIGTRSTVASKDRKASLRRRGASAIVNEKESRETIRIH